MQKVPSSTEADSNTYGYTKRLSPRLQQRFRQAWPALIIACREGYPKTAKRLLRISALIPIYKTKKAGHQYIMVAVRVSRDSKGAFRRSTCPME